MNQRVVTFCPPLSVLSVTRKRKRTPSNHPFVHSSARWARTEMLPPPSDAARRDLPDGRGINFRNSICENNTVLLSLWDTLCFRIAPRCMMWDTDVGSVHTLYWQGYMTLACIPCFLPLPVRVPMYADIQREAAYGIQARKWKGILIRQHTCIILKSKIPLHWAVLWIPEAGK